MVTKGKRAPRYRTALIAGLCLVLTVSCAGSEPPVPTPTVPPPTPTLMPPTPTPEPTATPIPTPTPIPPTPTPDVPPVSRLTEIPNTHEQQLATDLLLGEPGIYGFVVLDEDGTIIASHNGTVPFITASTYKIILMADIYRRIELGQFALDQYIVLDAEALGYHGDMYFGPGSVWSSFTLQEYLFAMGAYSSNAAARTLLKLTTPTALRQTALAIGMEDTYLFVDLAKVSNWPPALAVDAYPEDLLAAQTYLQLSARETGNVNITTPLDMARYQLAVVHDKLISPWVSEQVANVLLQQKIRDRIPAYFPHITVFNKPGNLPDAVNDVGVLFLADGPRALATMAQAVPDPDRATLIEQRLALIAAGVVDIPPLYWGELPGGLAYAQPTLLLPHRNMTRRRPRGVLAKASPTRAKPCLVSKRAVAGNGHQATPAISRNRSRAAAVSASCGAN